MKTTYIYGVLIVVIVAGLIAVKNSSDNREGDPARMTAYDTFAQCLSDAGATFYGAYWCPHCQEQKRMFENSSYLPYVECSTPNGQAQTPVCIEKKITGYPTWELADGTRLDGTQTLDTLAERTNCTLPTS